MTTVEQMQISFEVGSVVQSHWCLLGQMQSRLIHSLQECVRIVLSVCFMHPVLCIHSILSIERMATECLFCSQSDDTN